MKLFFYYSLHSFWNQLRKLFRTWMLIFILACMLLGGLIGFGAAVLSEKVEEQSDEPEEILTAEEEAEKHANAMAMLELAAGAAVLGILCYETLSADKNGSKIFLPADVNLLFPSPLSPQSVLMFRVGTQLGMGVFMIIYFMLEIPALMGSLGLSLGGAAALITALGLLFITGKLWQVLLYTVCSLRPALRQNLPRFLYGLLALVAVGFGLFWKRSGAEPLAAAKLFFNAPLSRYIPVWGWLKGFPLFAAEGRWMPALGLLGLVLLTDAVLFFLIRRSRADFYEDALAQSQETAELLERAQSESAGMVVTARKKDRSETLWRDGLRRGRGASVLFHKSMYNRFRFAHLHVFTKTMETYLIAGVAAALLSRTVLPWDGGMVTALALTVLVFFRALGNPLGEDARTDLFRMIPESPYQKLLWSLLAGSVNCLMDLLPGLLAGTLLARSSLLQAGGWLLFILSVDLYASCVSTFIDLSVPISLGKTIKQLIQILFVYFGLLPDAVILAVGMVTKQLLPAAAGAALVNLVLGWGLFLLCPRFLEPGAAARQVDTGVDLPTARRRFSRMGLAIFLLLGLASVLQLGAVSLVRLLRPEWLEQEWSLWVLTFAPEYLVSFPLAAAMLRALPAAPPEKRAPSLRAGLLALPVCAFMMLSGNLLGTLINLCLSGLTQQEANVPLTAYAYSQSLGWKLGIMVVLAPLWEEIIFRKLLIDRMRPYGEALAVLSSAAMFALFHANISQLFYAFTLGLLFGYAYLRTGQLRWSLGLHMLVNLFGSVVSTSLSEQGLAIYGGAIMVLAVAGALILLWQSRYLRFDPAPEELPRGTRLRTVWVNPGMGLFLLLCLGMIVYVVLA